MKLIYLSWVVAAGVAGSLTSCSSSSAGGDTAWGQATGNFYSGLSKVDSLKSAKVPLLRSAAYEMAWGKPEVRMTSAGDYELNYANPAQPFDRLVIQGTTRPFPKLTKAPKLTGEKMVNDELTGFTQAQAFRTVTIAGQTVRWFQETTSGGADGAYYSTEGFALKDSFGNTGYYRLVVEAGNEADREVAKRFGSVDFSSSAR